MDGIIPVSSVLLVDIAQTGEDIAIRDLRFGLANRCAMKFYFAPAEACALSIHLAVT